MTGRPTALTAEVQRRIVDAVAAGNYFEAAATYGGISQETFFRWMKWGESDSPNREPFRQFRKSILAAEAQAEISVVAQWKSQVPQNWQAARDFLGRRFPSRWGPKERLEHTGKDGAPIEIKEILVELPKAKEDGG